MTPIRTILAAAITLGTLAASANAASATSFAVKMACASDYHAHCSQHAPGSPGARQCMRAVGSSLSKGCINALVTAGEVKKSVAEHKVSAK